jgi:hypothetical protein
MGYDLPFEVMDSPSVMVTAVAPCRPWSVSMIKAVLPTILQPVPSPVLVRIGRDNDGGYLVDSRDVMSSDCLLSMGVNDDWSFEKGFVEQRDVPVQAYDGSVGGWVFLKRVLRNVYHIRHPRIVLGSVALLFDYFWFFSGRRKHICRFVGDATGYITMAQAFDSLLRGGPRRPYVKVDIEGSEYSVLDELIERAGATSGLVVEFHDCAQRMDQICNFVECYPLQLVHVHANNFGPVGSDRVPTVLELTFSSSHQPAQALLPHPLDMPNSSDTEEIAIVYSHDQVGSRGERTP